MHPLEIIAADKKIKEYVNNITGGNHLKDDLYCELMLILAEMPPEKLTAMIEKKQHRFFIIRIITNMWHSTTSRFYYQYRKNISVDIDSVSNLTTGNENKEDSIDLATVHEHIESEKKKFNKKGKFPYDAVVLEEYINHGSLRKLEKATGIPYYAVHSSLKISKQLIKNL